MKNKTGSACMEFREGECSGQEHKAEGRFRKATEKDISAVSSIYDAIHAREQAGLARIGWIPGIYPTRSTAASGVEREDLYVYEKDSRIYAAAVINPVQVDCYAQGKWRFPAKENEVLVLHTLVVDPAAEGQGIGNDFLEFYEQQARNRDCKALRMDTNAVNERARKFYAKRGYREVDMVPCVFNGIPNVSLVLLEKQL